VGNVPVFGGVDAAWEEVRGPVRVIAPPGQEGCPKGGVVDQEWFLDLPPRLRE
jgi:hypothetical protein